MIKILHDGDPELKQIERIFRAEIERDAACKRAEAAERWSAAWKRAAKWEWKGRELLTNQVQPWFDRVEAAEARVKELMVLVAELLSEYKIAKLLVIDEFVKSDYYDEAVAELNGKIAAYRVRAALSGEEE